MINEFKKTGVIVTSFGDFCRNLEASHRRVIQGDCFVAVKIYYVESLSGSLQ